MEHFISVWDGVGNSHKIFLQNILTLSMCKKILHNLKWEEILLGKIVPRDIMVHLLVNFSSIIYLLLLNKIVQFKVLEFGCHLKAFICSLLHYSLASIA